MASKARLIPNLAAEEGGDWTRHAERPGVATTARLWRHLFPSPNRLLAPRELAAHGPERWPEHLGERPERAAFDWLGGETKCWAWLADQAAWTLAGRLEAPAPEVTLRVHDKAFALRHADELGYGTRCLEPLIKIFDAAQLQDAESCLTSIESHVASWPSWTGGRFTLKPRLGCSGRGRVAGSLADFDRAGLRGALPRLAGVGGAVLEPWLARTTDLSVLLHIDPVAERSGPAITLLGSLQQLVTASGLYLGHAGEIDSRGRVFSGGSHEESIREAAAAVTGRAREEGYFGPCGVDAFAFELTERVGDPVREVLRPVVELNARFTVGIVLVGLIRRVFSQLGPPLSIEPGERRGFVFALDVPPGLHSWEQAVQDVAEPTQLVPLWAADSGPRPALLFAASLDALRGLEALRSMLQQRPQVE